jgi:hypothetical protein
MNDMRGILVAIVMIVSTAGLLGCERSEPTEAERRAIEGRVTAYLHALADAYSSLDTSELSEYATGSETSEVTMMIRGLVGTGDRVEARLLSVEFTTVTVFREINANVAANEVWEVVRFDAFSGHEKGRAPTTVQDTMFQLRKVDGVWMITARRVNPQGEPTPGTEVIIPTEADS